MKNKSSTKIMTVLVTMKARRNLVLKVMFGGSKCEKVSKAKVSIILLIILI